jgi:hypothetical protein
LREGGDPADLRVGSGFDSWDINDVTNLEIAVIHARVRCLDFLNLFVQIKGCRVVSLG